MVVSGDVAIFLKQILLLLLARDFEIIWVVCKLLQDLIVTLDIWSQVLEARPSLLKNCRLNEIDIVILMICISFSFYLLMIFFIAIIAVKLMPSWADHTLWIFYLKVWRGLSNDLKLL